jgi:type I restriction enzyme S subunit
MTRPNLNAVAMLSSEMKDAIGSTGFFVLRSRHVVASWLFYLVQTAHFIDSMSGAVLGVLYPAVRPKDIAAYSVSLPPAQEQSRIVAEIEKQFTRLDAAVAALKRVQVNLKRYRAALLKAACEGRLVSTEAELARKEGRSYETGEQLLARILKERRASWEADQLAKLHAARKPAQDDDWKKKYKEPELPDDKDLPTLPEGWIWGSLGQIAEIQGGIQKQPSRTPRENAYPFLRVANVYRGRLDLSEIHRIEVFGDELSKLRLCAGDLLIVEGNGSPTEIGRMAIWKGEVENCVHQNHIIRARLNSGVLPAYCAAYWNSSLGSSEVARVAGSTSGLYTLSVGKVSKIAIPIPPTGEQERIVNEMERVLTTLAEVEPSAVTNQRRADRLRQSVLKRAFEGKLVPQNPNDEPASALLERIRSGRNTQNSSTNGPHSRPRRNAKRLDAVGTT